MRILSPQDALDWDAAQRMHDTYCLHQIALGTDAIGKWFFFRLADGTSDNELYDSKRDAVRHSKHNERFHGYIQITPRTSQPDELLIFLRVQRQARANGLAQADPESDSGGTDLIRRSTMDDQRAQFRALFLPQGR